MNLKHRSYRKELMDLPQSDPAALHVNLNELTFINRFTGGYVPMFKAVRKLLNRNHATAVIADIGSGAGDFLDYVHRHRHRLPGKVDLVGLDREAFALDFAACKFPQSAQQVQWIHADYSRLTDSVPEPDIITAGLFCHHLDEDELVEFFRFCHHHCRLGFVVSDLHRHPLAYYSIKWLTRLFSQSEFTRHDAPLSVQRGFTLPELHNALSRAGIKNYTIRPTWAYRFLLTVPCNRPLS